MKNLKKYVLAITLFCLVGCQPKPEVLFERLVFLLFFLQISCVLYSTSATLTFGVTAATFTNPCLIIKAPYLLFFKISFNSSTVNG